MEERHEILTVLYLYYLITIGQGQLTNKFQRFQGYEIDNSTNFTEPCHAEDECIANCLNDSVCTAISMNYGVPGKCKPGKIARYGRIFLRKAINWTTWMRSMLVSFFLKDEKYKKLCCELKNNF